jgi:hypothetical protein
MIPQKSQDTLPDLTISEQATPHELERVDVWIIEYARERSTGVAAGIARVSGCRKQNRPEQTK